MSPVMLLEVKNLSDWLHGIPIQRQNHGQIESIHQQNLEPWQCFEDIPPWPCKEAVVK